jgi:hypothetical protein
MAVVRMAALKNRNARRTGDPLYKIRPPYVIIGKGDTVRFLNLTGADIEVAGPDLSFGKGRSGASLKLPAGGSTTIKHPGRRGQFPFTVKHRSNQRGSFTCEIHGESSPEIVVDQ